MSFYQWTFEGFAQFCGLYPFCFEEHFGTAQGEICLLLVSVLLEEALEVEEVAEAEGVEEEVEADEADAHFLVFYAWEV